MGKGFREAASEQRNVYDTIMGASDTKDIRNTLGTQDTEKKEYYRFNLKMPVEYRTYLQQAAFNASTPDHLVTVTEYICGLIQADMDRSK